MTRFLQLSPDSAEYGAQCPECGGWLKCDFQDSLHNERIPEREFLDGFIHKAQRWSLVCEKCYRRVDWAWCQFLAPPYVRLIGSSEFDDDPDPKLEVVSGEEEEKENRK